MRKRQPHGICCLQVDDELEELRLFDREIGRLHAFDIPVLSLVLEALLGCQYAEAGRVSDGLSLLQQELDLSPGAPAQTLATRLFVRASIMADRLEDAQASAARTLALSRKENRRGAEGGVLKLLGDIAARLDTGDSQAAADYYRQAMTAAGELGLRPLLAHSHLGLGRVLTRGGDRDLGREHLGTAATMFREMDMRSGPDQAEAAMREVGTGSPSDTAGRVWADRSDTVLRSASIPAE